MHILVFEQQPDNRLGGQERSLFEACRGLAERGVQISLVYRKKGNLLIEYKKFCKCIYLVKGNYRFNLTEIGAFIKSAFFISRIVLAQNVTCIYVNQYMDITLAAIAGNLTRKPIICHLRLPVGPYLSRQYRWGLNHCKKLIAISEYTKKEYREARVVRPEIQVIHNGTDLTYFQQRGVFELPKEEETPEILYAGRIVPSKGIETLLKAFALIPRSHSARLTLLGNPSRSSEGEAFLAKLKELAKELRNQIQFIPHQEDIRPFLEKATLVVLPSHWGEPFGRILIEAMAMEVPVVASCDGGIPEILGDRFAGHLVPPGDIEELAAKIVQFIDWKKTQPSLGIEMRREVERRFSGEETIDKIFNAMVS